MVPGEDWVVPDLFLGNVNVPCEPPRVPGNKGGGMDGFVVGRELREVLDVALSETVCEIAAHTRVAGESEGGREWQSRSGHEPVPF